MALAASRRRHSIGIALSGLAFLGFSFIRPGIAKSADCSWTFGKCTTCVHDHLLRLEEECHAAVSSNKAPPSGCATDYRILKSNKGCNDFLLIPTRRMPGLEAPELQKAKGLNYWAIAWTRAKEFVPCHDIGLAVNSRCGRTENQLHIHMSCVQPGLRSFLDKDGARITGTWSAITAVNPYGPYRLIRIGKGSDPFKLMLTLPGAQNTSDWKEKETLALIPVESGTDKAGFYLLAGRCDGDKSCGFAEGLLNDWALCEK
jgi:CDP-diacylglycerol pyrophosphatase